MSAPVPPVPFPPPFGGARRYNVQRYGAVPAASDPGPGKRLDDAWDKIRPLLPADPNVPVSIYLPGDPGTYWVNDPILFDRSNLTVEGDGKEVSRVSPVSGRAVDCLVFGLWQAPGGQTLADDHWPDLNGKVGFATAPGQYYGFSAWSSSRPTNYAHVTFPPGRPFANGPGDYWTQGRDGQTGLASSTSRQITWEFCLDFKGAPMPAGGAGAPPTAGALLGITDPRGYGGGPRGGGAFYPLTNGVLQYRFKTSEQTGSDCRTLSIPLGSGNLGVVHVALCLDLVNAACYAFVNGVQTAGSVGLSGSGSAFASGSNLYLAPNYHYSFNVGTESAASYCAYATSGTDRIPYPVNLYGLKVSTGLRYRNNGSGQPQIFTSNGAAPSDAQRYLYDGSPGMIAILRMTDKPASLSRQGGRVVHSYTGTGVPNNNQGETVGYVLNTGVQGAGNYNGVHNRVHNLSVVSQLGWGSNIACGAVQQFTTGSVRTSGSWSPLGIGVLNMGTGWGINVEDGWEATNGYDNAIYLYQQIAQIGKGTVDVPGTTVIRAAGCALTVEPIYCEIHPGSVPTRNYGFDHFFKFHPEQAYSSYKVRGFKQDGENSAYPAKSVVSCGLHWNTGTETVLDLDDFWYGAINAAAVFVDLDDYGYAGGANGFNRGRVRVRGVSSFSPSGAAWVRTNGPGWSGVVEDLPHTTAVKFVQANGSANNVRVVHRDFDGVPSAGIFTAGAHEIWVRNPAAGGVACYYCTTSGDASAGAAVFKPAVTLGA